MVRKSDGAKTLDSVAHTEGKLSGNFARVDFHAIEEGRVLVEEGEENGSDDSRIHEEPILFRKGGEPAEAEDGAD